MPDLQGYGPIRPRRNVIFTVEVDVALYRPPADHATIFYVIDATDGTSAELTACMWAYCHPRVSMPVRSVITSWSEV